ncbi:hypothetical protein [Streptomyces sp. NPDC014656]|uniref:hypothetical protein n=1 Tax=Streptomyces sp. NPDC014656 TaxID=3364878 RepID=UPI0036FED1F1
MRIHRIPKHDREFVVIANKAIQDPRLSHTARGILALVLSLPDGVRENARTLSDNYPQGRRAVEGAVAELRLFGYWVTQTAPDERTRQIVSTIDVYELPPAPDSAAASAPVPGDPVPAEPVPTRPVTGSVGIGKAGTSPYGEKDGKKQGKENPPLPPAEAEPRLPAPEAAREGENDSATEPAPTTGPDPAPAPDRKAPGEAQEAEAARVLRRLASVDARLRLSARQVTGLVPAVADWLDRGATVTEIIDALTEGLPRKLYSARAVLADRLDRKRPAPRRRWKSYADCADGCGGLLPEGQDSGSCAACSGDAPSDTGPSGTAPSDTAPSGTAPSGTGPSDTGPSGTAPSGTAPSDTGPSGTARASLPGKAPGPLAPEGFAVFRAARGALLGDGGRRAAVPRPGRPLAPQPAAGALV